MYFMYILKKQKVGKGQRNRKGNEKHGNVILRNWKTFTIGKLKTLKEWEFRNWWQSSKLYFDFGKEAAGFKHRTHDDLEATNSFDLLIWEFLSRWMFEILRSLICKTEISRFGSVIQIGKLLNLKINKFFFPRASKIVESKIREFHFYETFGVSWNWKLVNPKIPVSEFWKLKTPRYKKI